MPVCSPRQAPLPSGSRPPTEPLFIYNYNKPESTPRPPAEALPARIATRSVAGGLQAMRAGRWPHGSGSGVRELLILREVPVKLGQDPLAMGKLFDLQERWDECDGKGNGITETLPDNARP